MTQVTAEARSCVQSRPWSERKVRGLLRKPDRLTGIDGRSRIGREFKRAFLAASREFPAAPADRVAELARLRAIASQAQQAALTGAGSADAALRATSAADRCARDLGGKAP
jgi:hypothetical protein